MENVVDIHTHKSSKKPSPNELTDQIAFLFFGFLPVYQIFFLHSSELPDKFA